MISLVRVSLTSNPTSQLLVPATSVAEQVRISTDLSSSKIEAPTVSFNRGSCAKSRTTHFREEIQFALFQFQKPHLFFPSVVLNFPRISSASLFGRAKPRKLGSRVAAKRLERAAPPRETSFRATLQVSPGRMANLRRSPVYLVESGRPKSMKERSGAKLKVIPQPLLVMAPARTRFQRKLLLGLRPLEGNASPRTASTASQEGLTALATKTLWLRVRLRAGEEMETGRQRGSKVEAQPSKQKTALSSLEVQLVQGYFVVGMPAADGPLIKKVLDAVEMRALQGVPSTVKGSVKQYMQQGVAGLGTVTASWEEPWDRRQWLNFLWLCVGCCSAWAVDCSKWRGKESWQVASRKTRVSVTACKCSLLIMLRRYCWFLIIQGNFSQVPQADRSQYTFRSEF